MYKITVFSDSHSFHKKIEPYLEGGDILICGGDFTSRGYIQEIKNFFKWLEALDYDHLITIAGNHDWGFEVASYKCEELLKEYLLVDYLQDNLVVIGEDYQSSIKIYGSPWQPEFYNWAS